METMNIDDFRRSKQNEPVVLTHWVKTDNELYHGGPGSGRYPWGSGDRPYQRLEQAHGGIFRRKRRTTESLRSTLNSAQKRIDANSKKTQEDIRKASDAEREAERDRKERPLTYLTREANKRAASAEGSKKIFEKAPKKQDDTVKIDNNEVHEERRTNINGQETKTSTSTSTSSAPAKEAVKETVKQVTAPAKKELRDLSTHRNAYDMSNEELREYNARRKMVDTYNSYKMKDRTATWDAVEEVVKSGRSAFDSIAKSINDKYVTAHKQAKANMDLSDLSDDELKKRVNRLSLEQQYRNLSPEITIEGEASAKRALSVIGTTLTIASIAVPVAKGIASTREPRRR